MACDLRASEGMPSEERTAVVRRPASDEGRVLAHRYRLFERIDEGGAGEVWRGRDEKLDRDVAIKLLGADADDAFRARFADEARRAAAVVHPNVVTVFDEGRDGADAFMVMEYVPGKTLRDLVAERGPLPPHEASRLVAQVAAGLDAANAAGVIHCDVKPANVIVDRAGLVKLTDFGIARAARDRDDQELLGTARYIAPERIEGGEVTARTDVYGLGLLAYELLAGRPAFEGVSTEELMRLRLESPPPSLRFVRVGIDDAIDGVVTRALSRDPGRRQASAGEFARALASATERGDETAPLGMVALPRTIRRWSFPRLDSTVALLAMVAVLVTLLVFFASFPRGLAPAPTPAASATARATLLAVADGVGGVAGGEVASAVAVNALAARFFATVARRGRAEALAAAMREANDAVLAATGTADQHGAASTLVAAAIGANDAAVGNLGDSRAYLVRDRAVRRLTADHSGDAPNSITRFVGDPRGVQPDVFVEELLPGDRLVLCSDGLTRYVSDEEIAAQVSEASLDRAAGTLVDLANARGGEDNVTVVLYAAAPRGMVVASVGGALVNAALALLVAIVIAGAVAAVLFASGALPSSP